MSFFVMEVDIIFISSETDSKKKIYSWLQDPVGRKHGFSETLVDSCKKSVRALYIELTVPSVYHVVTWYIK